MSSEKKIDPKKSAIALKYDPLNDAVPTIVATGKGYVAEKILEQAKIDNVPTHKDPWLAKSLSNLEIGDSIPPELYQAVAQVLVFVEDMERLKKGLDESRGKN